MTMVSTCNVECSIEDSLETRELVCMSGKSRDTLTRMLKKAVQQGRRRIETGGVPSGYVEDFDETRTKLAGFFSILLMIVARIPVRPPTFFYQDKLVQQRRRDRVQKTRRFRQQHATSLIEHVDRVRQK
jgi:hypothetical protein